MKNKGRDIFRKLEKLENRKGNLKKRDQQLMYKIRKLQQEKKGKFQTKVIIFLDNILRKANKLFK